MLSSHVSGIDTTTRPSNFISQTSQNHSDPLALVEEPKNTSQTRLCVTVYTVKHTYSGTTSWYSCQGITHTHPRPNLREISSGQRSKDRFQALFKIGANEEATLIIFRIKITGTHKDNSSPQTPEFLLHAKYCAGVETH